MSDRSITRQDKWCNICDWVAAGHKPIADDVVHLRKLSSWLRWMGLEEATALRHAAAVVPNEDTAATLRNLADHLDVLEEQVGRIERK